MSVDIRAILLVFAALAIGGIIYAMSTGEEPKVVPMDTEDASRFPWRLEELYRPPTGWRLVGRYPTLDICHKKGHEHRAKTGRRFRCRKSG